jgi:hypothetical protein
MPGVRPQLNTMVMVKNKVIRATSWYRIVTLLAAALFFVVPLALFYTHGLSWVTSISFLFPAIGILAAYEVFSSRVILGDNSIDIVSSLRKRSFDRSQVSTVKVDGGRVFIKIEGDAGWVELPELGRNSLSMSNTIRAWLRRT